jgi:hypothetical protein
MFKTPLLLCAPKLIACSPNKNYVLAGCVLFCCTCHCHHLDNVHQHHQCLPCPVVQKYAVHFVVHIYDLNTIIVCALLSCTDASMVKAFTKVITTLKSRGYTPALNVMDNECSAAVQKYIRSEKIIIQLVPPHIHHVNAAEWAIATFKEHFIANLATVDTHCPLQLWDEFLPQVELTLNMPCFSSQNPKKSANQEVYGSFDFSKIPLALLGTKTLIYDNPASHASWAPHATIGFYVGPASDHYRCLCFYIPATRCFCFSDTLRVCSQFTPKSLLFCNMTSLLKWQPASSKCLGPMYQPWQL